TQAPAEIATRIEATLSAIAARRAQVEERNARLLSLQDALSHLTDACDDALGRIEDARREAVARVFAHRGLPIWKIGQAAAEPVGERSRAGNLSSELAVRADNIRIYLGAHPRGSLLTLLLGVIATMAIYRERRRALSDRDRAAALAESLAPVIRAP